MYKKKTKEQLKEAKKARENLTSILANIRLVKVFWWRK